LKPIRQSISGCRSTCEDVHLRPLGDSTGDFVWQTSQLSPGYPASPGGQLSFVTDELSILAQVPGGLGAGLFYWAPD